MMSKIFTLCKQIKIKTFLDKKRDAKLLVETKFTNYFSAKKQLAHYFKYNLQITLN